MEFRPDSSRLAYPAVDWHMRRWMAWATESVGFVRRPARTGRGRGEGRTSALAPEDYETLRVEAGLPAVGHELTEDYTPHETNLAAWISETKGCYTGQEILARQVTYDKITRHLVGLKLDAPAQAAATIPSQGRACQR